MKVIYDPAPINKPCVECGKRTIKRVCGKPMCTRCHRELAAHSAEPLGLAALKVGANPWQGDDAKAVRFYFADWLTDLGIDVQVTIDGHPASLTEAIAYVNSQVWVSDGQVYVRGVADPTVRRAIQSLVEERLLAVTGTTEGADVEAVGA